MWAGGLLPADLEQVGRLLSPGQESGGRRGFSPLELVVEPLSDIRGSFAEAAIRDLVDEGVIQPEASGLFHPNLPVTVTEFDQWVARALPAAIRGAARAPAAGTPAPSTPAPGAPVPRAPASTGAPSEQARGAPGTPDTRATQPLTRAEGAVRLARALHLVEGNEAFAYSWQSRFRDLQPDHPAFRAAHLLLHLDLLPQTMIDTFAPEQPLTRAEAAVMVHRVRDLSVVRGVITYIDPETRGLAVQDPNKESRILPVGPAAAIFRNNGESRFEDLREGDQVYILGNHYGEPLYIRAWGMVVREDLLTRLSSLLKGVLRPDQIQAILRGDWQTATASLGQSLAQRLLGQGLSRAEVNAVMSQDWLKLEGLALQRVARAVAAEWGISPELAQALIRGDWERVKTLAQTEVASLILERVLGQTAPEGVTPDQLRPPGSVPPPPSPPSTPVAPGDTPGGRRSPGSPAPGRYRFGVEG